MKNKSFSLGFFEHQAGGSCMSLSIKYAINLIRGGSHRFLSKLLFPRMKIKVTCLKKEGDKVRKNPKNHENFDFWSKILVGDFAKFCIFSSFPVHFGSNLDVPEEKIKKFVDFS